jgi:DNA repair protein RecN (Recombination protein N)
MPESGFGEKASSTVIRAGAETATVECVFNIEHLNSDAKEFLTAHNLIGADRRLVLKREVSVNGRSRAWINGENCLLNVLKEVGNLLVDLHGQHDHQSLLNSETHIDFLDAFGDFAELREQVAAVNEFKIIVRPSESA